MAMPRLDELTATEPMIRAFGFAVVTAGTVRLDWFVDDPAVLTAESRGLALLTPE